LVLFVIAAGILWRFQKSFSLKPYEEEAKKVLRQKYSISLHITNLHYTVSTSLKIIADNIMVEGEDFSASSGGVEISLPLVPLIIGSAVISDITIGNPAITLKRYKDGKWNVSSFMPDKEEGKISVYPIKRIALLGGQIKIIDEFKRKKPLEFLIAASALNIDSPGIVAPGTIRFSGFLQTKDGPADIRLLTKWGQKGKGRELKDYVLNGSLSLGAINLNSLKPFIGDVLPSWYQSRMASANLTFQGNPVTGLNFESRLSLLGTAGVKKEKILLVNGKYAENSIDFKKIFIKLPEIALNGSANITNIRGKNPHMKLAVDTPFIDISRLRSLISPAQKKEPLMKLLDKVVPRGKFKFSNLKCEGPLNSFTMMDQLGKSTLVSGKMEVKGVTFKLDTLKYPVTGLNGSMHLEKNTITFKHINAVYGSNVLQNIEGVIDNYRTHPILIAQINANIDVKEFHEELLSRIKDKDLLNIVKQVSDTSGQLGIDFHLTLDIGESKITGFYGELYLDNIGFKHEFFNLPIRELRGKAFLDGHDIHIKHASWNTGTTVFQASGDIKNYQSEDYSFDLTFQVLGDVSGLARTLIPRVGPLKKLEGNIKATLAVKGNLNDLVFSQKADFSGAEYALGTEILKPRGVVSKVATKGSLRKKRILKIDSLNIELARSNIKLSGAMPKFPAFRDYNISVDIKNLQMEDLPDFIPSFAPDGAQGTVTGKMKLVRIRGTDTNRIRIKADVRNLQLEPLKKVHPILEFLELKGNIAGKVSVNVETGKPFDITGTVSGTGVGFKTLLATRFHDIEGTGRFADNHFLGTGKGKMGKSAGKIIFDAEFSSPPVVNMTIEGDVIHLSDIVDLKALGQSEEPEEKDPDEIHAKWGVAISSKTGTLNDIRYENLDMFLSYYKGQYEFPRFRFHAYDGAWDLSGSLDTSQQDRQIFRGPVKVTGLALKDFLKDVIPEMNKMDGILDVQGEINGDGLAWAPFSHTLTGKLNLKVRDGIINKFEGLSMLFSIFNITPLFKYKKEHQQGEGLPFRKITGTFDFKNGVAHTEDLRLEGDVIRMAAVGDIDIGDKKLDLTMQVKPFTTIDSIISSIPLVGGVLTGKEKSLVSSYYKISGTFDDTKAESLPGKSIGKGVLGIIERVLKLPGKVISGGSEKKTKEKKDNKK